MSKTNRISINHDKLIKLVNHLSSSWLGRHIINHVWFKKLKKNSEYRELVKMLHLDNE